MKKKLLIVFLIVLTVGIFVGFTLGNEVFPPKMDENLIHWTYRGTISDMHSPGKGSYVITLEQDYGQGQKVIRITTDTKIVGDISPKNLRPGDNVWLWTAYYQQTSEITCVFFSVTNISE